MLAARHAAHGRRGYRVGGWALDLRGPVVSRSVTAVVLVSGLLLGALLGVVLAGLLGPEADLRPSLPASFSAEPLGKPAPAPLGEGGYKVLHEQTGPDGATEPVRWDPCRPIVYVVRADGAPPGGAAALQWAITRMSAVTGLQFEFGGYTDETPQSDRPALDRDRYGDRWSPVLIAWTDPVEYAPMAGYAGLGGPAATGEASRGDRHYVSGSIYLNRDHLTQVESWPLGIRREQAVILHELGHLVGLDHVEDAAELMSRQPGVTALDLGSGDLRGLAAVSGGRCYPES